MAESVGRSGWESVPLVSLQFQDAVFDGPAGAKFFFQDGEERRFSIRVHLQPRDDRHYFSASAAFLEADHDGGRWGACLFSQKEDFHQRRNRSRIS
jgi:hypothetical protein